MSDSTYGTFQGFPVRALIYRRARGYTPGGAEILLAAKDFPGAFAFEPPAPGALAKPAADVEQVSSSSQVGDGPRGPAPLARGLSYEGWLVMSEVVDGKTFAHPPVRLFVERVESVRLSDEGGTAMLRVLAWDERFHWEHGWVKRWSFNRRRADGTVSLDSTNPDASLVSRRQIAEQVVGSMFRKPQLTAAPAEWDRDTSAVDFGPNPAAVTCLARLVRESDLEEPCLRLDGSVALHRAGEGFVGWAEGGKGPNAKPFPPGLLLWKEGTGQGTALELGYPEDFVLVAGGPRVATVAIDDCEPVVVIEDVVFVLNDKNVSYLTSSGGKVPGAARDTAWLRKFVFSPAEWAGDPLVPEPILEVFRTQAYRLWRVPGVEVERAAEVGTPGQSVVREPGPNAHLMPMLARAELVASKRLPITVECYRFAVRRKKLEGSGATARQQAAIAELQTLRGLIAARAAQTNENNPFNPRPGGASAQLGRGFGIMFSPWVLQVPAGSTLNFPAVRGMDKAGVSVSDLEDFVKTVRTIKRVEASTGGRFAKLYEDALAARYAAEDEASGVDVNTTLFKLAKDFVALEEKANEDGSTFDNTADAFRKLGLDLQWSQLVVDAMNKIRLQREEQTRVGGSEGKNSTHTFFVNVGRTVDTGARVYDEDRGIVETSGLAGHLKDPNVHDLGHPDAELIPCPVRITFGAHVRPQVDRPPGGRPPTPPRVQTGVPDDELPTVEAGDCPGGQTYIPPALSDEQSYFVAAFGRSPDGKAVPLDPSGVPQDQVLVVQRPDLAELVPLEGTGNAGELNRQAAEVAAELFRRPTRVRAATATIAHAWPVQCDGLVQEVTIQMRQKDGIPCGYETVLQVGGEPRGQQGGGGPTREDPGRRGAAALRAQQAAAQRERINP